jgi:hypothetical protein
LLGEVSFTALGTKFNQSGLKRKPTPAGANAPGLKDRGDRILFREPAPEREAWQHDLL